VSCVWVGLEGEEIVSGHMLRRQKVRNVERDPNVALSLVGNELNDMGLREYLVVRGTARVQEGGAAELLQRLAHVYLGQMGASPPRVRILLLRS
jgi:Pyridoxamine 5'-phosphate oxidase